MNRHTPSPTVVWPYRPRNTRLAAEPPTEAPALDDEGFDDVAARLAGPGRALQQTMDAMVRSRRRQGEFAHESALARTERRRRHIALNRCA